MPKTHDLKILPVWFEAVKHGWKTAEIRANDRGFQEGDILVLREYTGLEYTGEKIHKEISHISDLSSLSDLENYVLLSFAK